jgi:hypothetical protein
MGYSGDGIVMMPKQDEKKTEGNVECADQMELDLDDLDDAAGGEKHYDYPPFQGIGSEEVYDRIMQLRNHTFRR